MSCRGWEDLLQQHLDGECPWDTVEQHLVACPSCVVHHVAVQQLVAGLRHLAAPPCPAALSERLVTALLAETSVRPMRTRRRIVHAVLAAAAVFLVSLVALRFPAARPHITADLPDQERAEAPEPIRDSVARAGSVALALTSRTAEATVEPTAQLLPLVSKSTMDPLASAPRVQVDPPLQPLREVSEEVTAGLAPVADSARRAVNLFLRDLPMNSGIDNPPN